MCCLEGFRGRRIVYRALGADVLFGGLVGQLYCLEGL